jgi:hypothetical protein
MRPVSRNYQRHDLPKSSRTLSNSPCPVSHRLIRKQPINARHRHRLSVTAHISRLVLSPLPSRLAPRIFMPTPPPRVVVMIAFRADSKLLCNIDISLAAHNTSILDPLDHILVALPGTATVRAGDLGFFRQVCLLPLGSSPHFEALLVYVLAARCATVDYGLNLGSFRRELVEADGAIAFDRLATWVMRLGFEGVRVDDRWGGGEDRADFGGQKG